MESDCSNIPVVGRNSVLYLDLNHVINAIFVLLLIFSCYVWYKYFWSIIDWREDFYDSYEGFGGFRSSSWRKAQFINEARKSRRLEEFPHPYPNGWYILMDSYELKKNVAKEVHVLGQNLVIWRGQSGKVYLSDAYCPHLGAHLGVGGTVDGECIRCPFHSWEFDGSCGGQLSKIPYSSTILKSVKLQMKRVLEKDNVIFIWYHEENEEPTWFPEMPKQVKGMRLRGKFEFTITTNIPDVVENIMDYNHFRYLHQFSKVQLNWLKQEGEGKEHLSNFEFILNLGFCGIKIPFVVHGTIQGPSMYFGTMELPLGTYVQVVDAQPIDPMVSKMSLRFYSKHYFFNPIDTILLLVQYYVTRQDLPIWNRKTYRRKVTLPKEDEVFQTGRNWYKRFYSSKTLKAQENLADAGALTDQSDPKEKKSNHINSNGKANGVKHNS